MKLCRLILLILIGLIMSPDVFAGKDDREPQTTTAFKNAPTPADKLLNALSVIFETTDHHVITFAYQMRSESLGPNAQYGNMKPQNVAPILRQRALDRICAALFHQPGLFLHVVTREDAELSCHYYGDQEPYVRVMKMSLTRALWEELSEPKLRKQLIKIYSGAYVYVRDKDKELKRDLRENTPYRDCRPCNPLRIKGKGWM